MSNRSIVVGIDGATPELLDPWLDAEALPNLRRLEEGGVAGPLRTVIPTQSVPAWPSFNTSKNPGKHGLFAFNEDVKTDGSGVITSEDLHSHRFWDYLADASVPPGILGAMLSHPPRDLPAGFEISGPLTPPPAIGASSPSDVGEELLEAIGEYVVDPDVSGPRDSVKENCLRAVESRIRASKYLMENREWEFFFTLFISTDRAQHKLWNTPEEILDVYEPIDEYVGWLLREYPDANLFVVSDHGFTSPAERDFFIGSWVNSWASSDSELSDSGPTPSWRYSVAKKVYSTIRRRVGLDLRSLAPASLEAWLVDSDRSDESLPIRPATNTHFDGIVVSSTLPDYERIREELVSALESVRDPEFGEPVFQGVWKREALYSGPYLSKIPDIVLLPTPRFNVNANPYHSQFGLFPGMENEGTHDAAPEGVFFAHGPDVARSRARPTLDLLDVGPTVLHLMDVPIPEDVDGVVDTEILTGDSSKRSVQYQQPMDFTPTTAADSQETHASVENRLEDLGYL